MEPVKFGVIGVGGMGGGHARAFEKIEEAQLVAVADVNAETAQKVAGETGATAFSSAEELIGKGGVEAILIATPHFFHPPVAEYAAQHGVHVLSEKPIAVTVSAADKMVEAAEKGGVLLGLMFNQRTEPLKKKMHEIIASGELGEIYRISMTAPWYRTQAYYGSGSWRGTWKGEGGGILMNQAPHQLDLLAWMGGSPKSIFGVAGTRGHQIEVENTSVSILDYGGGKTGWFYTSTAEASGLGERFEVAGDNGALVLEGGKLRRYTLDQPLMKHLTTSEKAFEAPSGSWSEVEVENAPHGHTEVTRAFAKAVAANDPSLMVASGRDGVQALELANAMLLAGYTRREVKLPVDRAAVEDMLQKLQNGAKPEELAA